MVCCLPKVAESSSTKYVGSRIHVYVSICFVVVLILVNVICFFGDKWVQDPTKLLSFQSWMTKHRINDLEFVRQKAWKSWCPEGLIFFCFKHGHLTIPTGFSDVIIILPAVAKKGYPGLKTVRKAQFFFNKRLLCHESSKSWDFFQSLVKDSQNSFGTQGCCF